MLIRTFKKIQFWIKSDRIGPDIPINHWKLYFNKSMFKLCKKKFKYFHPTASFRPGAYAIACSNISLGANVTIRPGTMLHGDPCDNGAEIIIEDHVLIGSGVHIYVDNHSFEDVSRPILEQGWRPAKPVTIKEGAWIGANAIILAGVTVGKNAVIGAGSIVTKNIPDFSVAAGVPARVIKELL
jgi:acetyltransferase-like isoleucine patch superfamily enzyme